MTVSCVSALGSPAALDQAVAKSKFGLVTSTSAMLRSATSGAALCTLIPVTVPRPAA
jgi:hypothetical protein